MKFILIHAPPLKNTFFTSPKPYVVIILYKSNHHIISQLGKLDMDRSLFFVHSYHVGHIDATPSVDHPAQVR